MEGLIIGFFALFVVWVGFCIFAVGNSQKKEKEMKLELMRKHPEHAAQIQQAIAMQEKQFRAAMQGIFQPNAPKPKKQGSGLLLKLGMGLVKRLVK